MQKQARKLRLKHRNAILLIGGILLLLALAASAYIYSSKEATIDIADRCGVIANNVMHTISDADACSLRCLGQCEAENMELKSSNYGQPQQGCNTCSCTCAYHDWSWLALY